MYNLSQINQIEKKNASDHLSSKPEKNNHKFHLKSSENCFLSKSSENCLLLKLRNILTTSKCVIKCGVSVNVIVNSNIIYSIHNSIIILR